MDMVKFIDAQIINEMALRKDLVNVDDIKTIMEELKSNGIDLSKYTYDEITTAFFFYLDDLLRGTTKAHQAEVMKYWKPSQKTTDISSSYNEYRNKLMTLLKFDIEHVKTVESPNFDPKEKRPVRQSLSWQELKSAGKGFSFPKEQKKGQITIRQAEPDSE